MGPITHRNRAGWWVAIRREWHRRTARRLYRTAEAYGRKALELRDRAIHHEQRAKHFMLRDPASRGVVGRGRWRAPQPQLTKYSPYPSNGSPSLTLAGGSKVANVDDQLILKRAKELCNEAGIAWDWSDTPLPDARVLDVAGRRELLMRCRQQLINELGDSMPATVEEEPKDVIGAIMAAPDRPTLATPPPPSHRVRDNAA